MGVRGQVELGITEVKGRLGGMRGDLGLALKRWELWRRE